MAEPRAWPPADIEAHLRIHSEFCQPGLGFYCYLDGCADDLRSYGWRMPGDPPLPADEAPAVKVAAYVVSRLPDDSADHSTWSVRVEAAGHGRWAIRNGGMCLNKQGEWEWEPQPSSREDDWLDTVRWNDADDAIAAAVAAEPFIRWNGLTAADVLARRAR